MIFLHYHYSCIYMCVCVCVCVYVCMCGCVGRSVSNRIIFVFYFYMSRNPLRSVSTPESPLHHPVIPFDISWSLCIPIYTPIFTRLSVLSPSSFISLCLGYPSASQPPILRLSCLWGAYPCHGSSSAINAHPTYSVSVRCTPPFPWYHGEEGYCTSFLLVTAEPLWNHTSPDITALGYY